MVASGALPAKGFIKQEEIPFDKLLNTQTGQLFTNGKLGQLHKV